MTALEATYKSLHVVQKVQNTVRLTLKSIASIRHAPGTGDQGNGGVRDEYINLHEADSQQ
jgi:hypothetical protein